MCSKTTTHSWRKTFGYRDRCLPTSSVGRKKPHINNIKTWSCNVAHLHQIKAVSKLQRQLIFRQTLRKLLIRPSNNMNKSPFMFEFHREVKGVCNCWHIEALNPIRQFPAWCLHSFGAMRSVRIPDRWHAATHHNVPWLGQRLVEGRGSQLRYEGSSEPEIWHIFTFHSAFSVLLHTFHTGNQNIC